MSSDIIALLNLRNDAVLSELNEKRPLATIPIGGKFRLIDFTLSNIVNAGIANVGLLLSSQSRSVLDHIRSGKEWGLARKGDGLFYLPASVEEVLHPVEGDVAAYYNNLLFVERGDKPYILLTGCDTVQNIDYDEVLHFPRTQRLFTKHRQKIGIAAAMPLLSMIVTELPTLNRKNRLKQEKIYTSGAF